MDESHTMHSHPFTERLTKRAREALSVTGLPSWGSAHALWRLTFVGGAIAATTIAHFVTPVEVFVLHNIFQRLYYVPIFAAAYWFGLPGAMAASIVSAASYLPHIVLDWGAMEGAHDEYLQAQYAELVMFQVVAFIAGQLARSEHRLRETQQRTSRELAGAYQKLRESFEHLKRADKLSSLGELSAGIAHEIKNPLASIKGSLEILASEFPLQHPKREFVDIMEKELEQLNRIVTEFLDFARTPRPVKALCDLRELASSVRVLCSQEAARHSVDLSVAAPATLPEVNVDASQVQQALLNVVLNGIQAMPKGGRLGVNLACSNGGIQMEIRDEGPGVRRDDRTRIFDPFFTTKARGTGLGLPIARKLIRAQGGDIRLLEESGQQGAAFVIDLPAGR
ncbi:MAG TPA: ATP-binding protein [Vicinamibacteria bacterium]|nr:ATP-binding protein [Vicinamibacteria bacterium]